MISNRYVNLFWFSVLVGGLWCGELRPQIVPQVDENKGNVANQLSAEDTPDFAGDLSLNMEQFFSFGENMRPHTRLDLAAGYRWDEYQRTEVQLPTQLYSKTGSLGVSAFRPGDLSLSHYLILDPNFAGNLVGLQFALTAPLSAISWKNENISKPIVHLHAQRDFWGQRIRVKLSPYFQTYLNLTKQTSEGVPLRKFSLGSALSTRLLILQKFYASVKLHLGHHWHYSFPRQDSQLTQFDYDFYLGYHFNPYITARFGYSQTDSFIKTASHSVVEENTIESLWYIAVDFSVY